MKQFFLLLTISLSIANPSFGKASACTKPEQAAKQKTDPDLEYLVRSKNPSKTIRSSAGHYWRVLHEIESGSRQTSLTPEELKILRDLFSVQGRVIGDAHNGNINPTRLENPDHKGAGKIVHIVVDNDDLARRAPLIGDPIHHTVAAKAVEMPKKIKLQKRDIFNSYLVGLSGRDLPIPPRIEEILKMDPRDYRALEIEKAKKYAKKDGISLNSRSTKLAGAERDQVKEVMQNALGEYYEVLDVGGREKETGGSAGALRYVALVRERSSGDVFLFEAKKDGVSAVNEYASQGDDDFEDRLDEFIFRNRPRDPRFKNISVPKDGQDVKMTLRPKPLYLFEFANKGNSKEAFAEFRDLTLYNAFWLGKNQHKNDRQNADLLLEKMNNHDWNVVYGIFKKLTFELNKFYEDNSG